MISVYKIKPAFQKLLRPFVRVLYRIGFTANRITWLAIILSVSVGVLFWMFPSGAMLWILPLALLVRMALNAMDGMMAREYKMQSKGGEVLNELGDVIADTAMYLPLIKLEGVNQWLLLGFIFLSILNEFSGVLGKVLGGARRYEGPMGKSDRALVIGAMCLMLFFIPGIIDCLNYIFGGMVILIVLSTSIRIKKALSEGSD